MSQVKILNRQNLLDIAVQELGGIEQAFELALANGKSITETLVVGAYLTADIAATNPDIVAFFNQNKIKSATALTKSETVVIEYENCGIGCMAIGSIFIIR